MLGEVGEADSFRYKKRALIYERLAEVVDTELIREGVWRRLRSKASEIARMMRMRTVAKMTPAIWFTWCYQLFFRLLFFFTLIVATKARPP